MVNVNDLEITKVRSTVFSQLLARIDIGENATTQQLLDANNAMDKLSTYVFGWGVTNDIEESDDLNDLCDILDATTSKSRKAVWVRHIVCKDSDEANDLMKRIMALEEGEDNDGDNG